LWNSRCHTPPGCTGQSGSAGLPGVGRAPGAGHMWAGPAVSQDGKGGGGGHILFQEITKKLDTFTEVNQRGSDTIDLSFE